MSTYLFQTSKAMDELIAKTERMKLVLVHNNAATKCLCVVNAIRYNYIPVYIYYMHSDGVKHIAIAN